MPEADMYHNSDPKIESATHKIRKKFRDTMNEIEYHGQGIHNVEAFFDQYRRHVQATYVVSRW